MRTCLFDKRVKCLVAQMEIEGGKKIIENFYTPKEYCQACLLYQCLVKLKTIDNRLKNLLESE